jgi:Ulp1 family protease
MPTREWKKRSWFIFSIFQYLFDEKNVNGTLHGRNNYENISKWIKKAPGNNIFNLKIIYLITNIDNNHWVCIVVYMEEKRIQYYNSHNGVGKGLKYFEGTLWYLYYSDEEKEHIKPVKWKLVLCAKTVPQQKNRVDYGAFVCIFCYYISHDSCLGFDESIIANVQKTITLSILNGKGAGDRSDITQSSQVHPIAAGTSDSIAVRDIPKGYPQVCLV